MIITICWPRWGAAGDWVNDVALSGEGYDWRSPTTRLGKRDRLTAVCTLDPTLTTRLPAHNTPDTTAFVRMPEALD